MRRGAVTWVGVSVALVAVAYGMAFFPALPPVLAPTLLALGTAGVLAGVLAQAVRKDGRLGLLWLPILTVVLVVGVGLVALVLMPTTDPGDPTLVLGLPPRAALLIYGVGLLPTLVVPVVYALTFERMTLSDEDLKRVREMAARRRRDRDGEDPA